MGKLGQKRRSRTRMTNYNLKKAKEVLDARDKEIKKLKDDIVELKEANKILKKSAVKVEHALKVQFDQLNEKHFELLKQYSSNLENKYKEKFDQASEKCQSEITSLKHQLQIERYHRLSLNNPRPIYSSGRYTTATDSSNTGDLSPKQTLNSNPENVDTVVIRKSNRNSVSSSSIKGYVRVPLRTSGDKIPGD